MIRNTYNMRLFDDQYSARIKTIIKKKYDYDFSSLYKHMTIGMNYECIIYLIVQQFECAFYGIE